MNQPSVGRVVRFVRDGVAYPAMLVHVHSDTCVNLYVFHNGVGAPTEPFVCNGTALVTSVLYSEDETKGNSWHWPTISTTTVPAPVQAPVVDTPPATQI